MKAGLFHSSINEIGLLFSHNFKEYFMYETHEVSRNYKGHYTAINLL